MLPLSQILATINPIILELKCNRAVEGKWLAKEAYDLRTSVTVLNYRTVVSFQHGGQCSEYGTSCLGLANCLGN